MEKIKVHTSKTTKIVFLGATTFSLEILTTLLENGFDISTVLSIPREFRISYSKDKVKNYNYADLESLAVSYNIPFYLVDKDSNKTLNSFEEIISRSNPDIILVMGWYYTVPKRIREIARLGAWGIHASLLPQYAGGAPLVWAMINGEKTTGVTLFRLDDGVDDGDIIAQEIIDIEYEDTIKDVYKKATEASKKILVNCLNALESINFVPQDKSKIEVFPQRSPSDGKIDLNLPSKQLYDFIRAQCSPYPGAYIQTVDGKKLVIEKARISDLP